MGFTVRWHRTIGKTTISNPSMNSNQFSPKNPGKGGNAEGGTTQQSPSKELNESKQSEAQRNKIAEHTLPLPLASPSLNHLSGSFNLFLSAPAEKKNANFHPSKNDSSLKQEDLHPSQQRSEK